jgi:putative hydrolase of the HAD superfamily
MAIKAVVFDWFGVLYENGQYDRELIAYIEELKRQYKVGLLSNTGRGSLQQLVAAGGVTGLFDVVLASGETAYAKPDREIFELIAEKLGVTLSDILFFDDSELHVQSARTYGMQAVLYRSLTDVQKAIPQQT